MSVYHPSSRQARLFNRSEPFFLPDNSTTHSTQLTKLKILNELVNVKKSKAIAINETVCRGNQGIKSSFIKLSNSNCILICFRIHHFDDKFNWIKYFNKKQKLFYCSRTYLIGALLTYPTRQYVKWILK